MQIIEDPNKMQETAVRFRSEGRLIALVSTSGALHAGHGDLVTRAREQSDVVVVSTIVNPMEFGPNEDYQSYPRTSCADAEFCEKAGVDILFRPSAAELFPRGFSVNVSEERISHSLCGISRPHYFPGVCTLHAILFNLVRPDHLVLGRRDAQKHVILSKLVDELRFPISVSLVETVRDAAGLPFNARNAYLNDFQRNDAATLYKALLEGKKLVDGGITNVDRILAEVTHHLSLVRRLRVIYVAAVDPQTMEPVRAHVTMGRTLLMAAIWCDEVRLIDNILL
ncbi:MAG: pantoate--beta-alanine ligase [Oceanipulchritudo sp.]